MKNNFVSCKDSLQYFKSEENSKIMEFLILAGGGAV